MIVSDNGHQYDNHKFKEFYGDIGIKNHYSSPRHPQANNQTEVINRTLLKIINAQLEGAKGLWLEELPGVLWAYQTIARTPIGETPFRLVFGIEAMIPVEVGLSCLWRTHYDEALNTKAKPGLLT